MQPRKTGLLRRANVLIILGKNAARTQYKRTHLQFSYAGIGVTYAHHRGIETKIIGDVARGPYRREWDDELELGEDDRSLTRLVHA